MVRVGLDAHIQQQEPQTLAAVVVVAFMPVIAMIQGRMAVQV